ncbi:hypothetical protein ACVILK_003750 [Bradyrhizobium embrapense]
MSITEQRGLLHFKLFREAALAGGLFHINVTLAFMVGRWTDIGDGFAVLEVIVLFLRISGSLGCQSQPPTDNASNVASDSKDSTGIRAK